MHTLMCKLVLRQIIIVNDGGVGAEVEGPAVAALIILQTRGTTPSAGGRRCIQDFLKIEALDHIWTSQSLYCIHLQLVFPKLIIYILTM